MRLEPKPAKALIVTCDYVNCINNEAGKCILDEIKISQDGICEDSFDRLKYFVAQARRNELDVKPQTIKR